MKPAVFYPSPVHGYLHAYLVREILMTETDASLLRIIAISKHAGSLIMEYYNDSCHVVHKADASPLTDADLASDAYIGSALSSTGIPRISEETDCAYTVRKDWDCFWLIDPLDGTKDFLQRNGEFTVNIALIRHGLPVLGVIHAPAAGITFYAEAGGGAFLEQNGRISKLPCFVPKEHLVATVSRQHLSAKTREFLAANGITRFEPRGSSLKFGIVASGEATVYPRFEGSMEWDIAAGHCILTEAGCRITDLVTGREPYYNKPSLSNNPFMVCSPQVETKTLSIPDLHTSPSP
jgi:3'(2'), 5'-bisphosphate nucleotidase